MPRLRNPVSTKRKLLQAALHQTHRRGFGGADLEAILEEAGVTKGALYHHFGSKRALGLTLVDEILRDWILSRWLYPLEQADDPIRGLIELARWAERQVTPQRLALGCPLNNLAQEVSAIDEEFRGRIAAIFQEWRRGLADLLKAGQQRGTVRPDVDVEIAATFVVAAWEGAIGLAKCERRVEVLSACRQGLESYLESLRPLGPPESTVASPAAFSPTPALRQR
jgi:AcrR family transcriptional regulator